MPRGCLEHKEKPRIKHFTEAFYEKMSNEFPECAPVDLILEIESFLEEINVVEKAGKRLKKKKIVSLDWMAKEMLMEEDFMGCEGLYQGFDFTARKIGWDGNKSLGLKIELRKKEEEEEEKNER